MTDRHLALLEIVLFNLVMLAVLWVAVRLYMQSGLPHLAWQALKKVAKRWWTSPGGS